MNQYTQKETVTIRGKNGEPLMDVDAEVVGIITLDDGEWFHNGAREVRIKMWDNEYKPVTGEAADIIYEAFCKVWTAQDLADLEAA